MRSKPGGVKFLAVIKKSKEEKADFKPKVKQYIELVLQVCKLSFNKASDT